MGLKTMSLLAGGTVATTGGTAQVFATNGITIPNGTQVIVPADTDYTTRRVATFKVRAASIDPKTGVYSKDKKSVTYVKPIVLASGAISFCTLRIEREVNPALSAADALEMNKIGAQLLVDSDVADFWANGSTE